MDERQFRQFLDRLWGSSFAERERFVREAVRQWRFTCVQLERVITPLLYPQERLAVAQIIAPHLADPENYADILPGAEYSELRTVLKSYYKRHTLLLTSVDQLSTKLQTRELV